MEELSLDNIMSESEVENLFTSYEDTSEPQNEETKPEEKDTQEETADTSEEAEESQDKDFYELDEEEEDTFGEEDPDSESMDSSPNFYSSITNALKDEGIFPDLNDEEIANVTTPEDFKRIVEEQIKQGISERQRRIDEALSVGVEPTDIQKYENTLNYLDSISNEAIDEESDNGEKLRKQLIYQDFINRGYSDERAKREVQKSLNAGSDIDDAKEALSSIKEFFNSKYNDLVNDNKKMLEEERKERDKKTEQFRKSIIENPKLFGDLELNASVRQKVFDNLSKPVYKDENGQLLTAIQKYERENREEFLKNVSVVFTLTNGFKDLNNILKGSVNKQVKSKLKDLEKTLSNTMKSSGALKMVTGVDKDSYIGKGIKLDL